jgi:Protein of unknown function (DUF4058)
MPSPFPGMDPYLEKPSLWPDVHQELISVIRAALTDLVLPKYFVQIGQRVYLSTGDDPGRTVLVPDVHILPRKGRKRLAARVFDGVGTNVAEPLIVETLIEETIKEHFLEIIDSEKRRVVTVIEVLSPDNKVSGSEGLRSFSQKRLAVMKSKSHWVEIDLLRKGVSVEVRKRIRPHDYFVLVSPVAQRPDGVVWPILLSQRLPVISIPLRAEDKDVRLDLQTVLDTTFDRARYELQIDYSKQPNPRLKPGATEWAHQLLKKKGLRPS